MSWWRELIEGFAQSFAEGYVETYRNRGTTRRAVSHFEYDFDDHMRSLHANTQGVSLVSLNPTSASFAINARGGAYGVVVTWRGENIFLTFPSIYKFPPGGAPDEIVRIVSERNKKIPNYDYDLIDDDEEAFFIVYGRTAVEQLDAPTFAAAINELWPAIVALDEWMEENDYTQ